MNTLVTAGAGFLLAVLWFDLMFDVQALRIREGELPEEALSSIVRAPLGVRVHWRGR